MTIDYIYFLHLVGASLCGKGCVRDFARPRLYIFLFCVTYNMLSHRQWAVAKSNPIKTTNAKNQHPFSDDNIQTYNHTYIHILAIKYSRCWLIKRIRRYECVVLVSKLSQRAWKRKLTRYTHTHRSCHPFFVVVVLTIIFGVRNAHFSPNALSRQ